MQVRWLSRPLCHVIWFTTRRGVYVFLAVITYVCKLTVCSEKETAVYYVYYVYYIINF